MPELVARSILRILGIVTALVGTILTSQALIAWMAVRATLSAALTGLHVPTDMHVQATGMLGEMGSYAIVAQAVTIALGAALFYMSPFLARRVVE